MNKESRALFYALQHRKSATDVKPLISSATAKTADCYWNLKPLFWALSYGASAEVLKLLLGAYPEAANEKHPDGGWTPLHYAEKLDVGAVKLLLDTCPGAAKVKDASGELPLHWAAEHNAPIDIVRLLLDAYPDAASVEDNLGRLPIKLAADNESDPALVELLGQSFPAGRAALPPPSVEDMLPIALLFPGQGSQYVKMLSEVKDLPGVQKMLAEAKQILGYDILPICMSGPAEKLQDTLVVQPAMYIAALAGVEKLKTINPVAVERPQAVAGLSLGEFAACTVAGVFSFADGLALVQERAQAMQEAANLRPQIMLSVAGLAEEKLTEICNKAKSQAGPDEVCQISNFLFNKGYTVGGTKSAVEKCQKMAEQKKALQARLIRGSGGFHTSLMTPAKDRLEKKLAEILPRMSRPRCQIIMNVNAQAVDWNTDPAYIAELLAQQLTSPVQWRYCVEALAASGIREAYECGPQKQIKAMMKRIEPSLAAKLSSIEV